MRGRVSFGRANGVRAKRFVIIIFLSEEGGECVDDERWVGKKKCRGRRRLF